MVTAFIIYVSSRPITGVPALQDWRFLLAAIILLIAFIRWEGRHPDPFVRLSLFSHSRFTLASVGASLRMFIMNSVGFLIPLYLADVYQLSASATGFVLTLHATALLITMRLGGHLADTLGSRRPVMVGSAVQGAVMVAFALLPAGLPTTVAIALAVVHGLGAGASLAPLHRAALGHIDPDQAGSAAGMYSMIRFGGLMLGTALCGVVLQFGLDWGLLTLQAYQLVFWMVAVVALLAMVVGYRLGATD
jgi:MFS family permease